MKKQISLGNCTIICEPNDNTIKLSIRLSNEKGERAIGYINTDDRTLYVRRTEKKHLLRKANSYGFNHYIIKEAKTFDKVCMIIGFNQWLIPNEVILNGDFLWFKDQGYERQIFLDVDTIEKYRII